LAGLAGRERITGIASRGLVFLFNYIVTVILAVHGILFAVMLNGYEDIFS